MCEGVDVWITHIGGYPGKYNPAIKAEMAAKSIQLFWKYSFWHNLLHMNGACGKKWVSWYAPCALCNRGEKTWRLLKLKTSLAMQYVK
jgi:hypothetical protein